MKETPIFRRAKDTTTDYAAAVTELLQVFRMFQSYLTDVIQLAHDESGSSAIKAAYEIVHEHYQKAKGLVDHLELWHLGLVEGKMPREWTIAERKQDALIRGLKGMISACERYLQDIYHRWLVEADLANAKDLIVVASTPIDHGSILQERKG